MFIKFCLKEQNYISIILLHEKFLCVSERYLHFQAKNHSDKLKDKLRWVENNLLKWSIVIF